MNSTSASESGTEDFYKKLWEEVQEHNPIQSTMEGRVAEPSQTPVHTQTSSIGWRSRQLQSHLEQAYNIYLVLDLTDHVLPKDSFHQDPSSEHMYLKKTDEECEIIAAQILRIKQCEENESTLISYLNSSLLPWPLVYHHPILGRIHDRPIFEISTLEEPPLHQQNNNNQYFSWKIIPDILYLYNVGRFEKNDILALKGLGLSKNIIALNGEFKSEAGSALQARTQLICAGVLVLWQRIKIRKAAACSDTSDLSHYCFSMCSGDFEFWCLKHVDDAFHAQQYACGTLINAAGVRKFIEIWNCVINHVFTMGVTPYRYQAKGGCHVESPGQLGQQIETARSIGLLAAGTDNRQAPTHLPSPQPFTSKSSSLNSSVDLAIVALQDMLPSGFSLWHLRTLVYSRLVVGDVEDPFILIQVLITLIQILKPSLFLRPLRSCIWPFLDITLT